MFLFSFLSDQVQSTTGNAGAGAGSGAYQNDSMIQIALSLLATALETGAEHLVRRKSRYRKYALSIYYGIHVIPQLHYTRCPC